MCWEHRNVVDYIQFKPAEVFSRRVTERWYPFRLKINDVDLVEKFVYEK